MGSLTLGNNTGFAAGALPAFPAGSCPQQFTQRSFDLSSTGTFYGQPISPTESSNLTELWVFIDSYGGTWSNTDQAINFTVYQDISSNYTPDTTNVVATGSIDLTGSLTGWNGASGLAISLTAGELYYIAIHDVDGGVSDYVTVIRDVRSSTGTGISLANSAAGSYTTNSWSSVTSNAYPCPMMYKIGSVYYGCCMMSASTTSSNTEERGNIFTPPDDCTLVGFVRAIDLGIWDDSAGLTLKLYEDGNNPGGTTLKTWSPLWNDGGATYPLPDVTVFPESDRVDLTGGTSYRLVFDYTSSLTTPRLTSVDHAWTGEAQTIGRRVLQGSFNLHATRENAGTWVDDEDATYLMVPLITLKTAAASSSGGGLKLVGKGGLIG